MSCSGSNALVIAVVCLLATACATGGPSMDVPEDFLQLRGGPAELKAITPDEGRLWVREFADPERGDLSFWAQALQNDLAENRGYDVAQRSEVRDAAGRPGVLMECAVTFGGEPRGYLIAVFVIEGSGDHRIRVAEFAAARAVYDSHVEAVKRSLATLR